MTGLEPGALIAGRYLLDRPIFPPTCWAAQDSVLGIHTEIRFSELSRWQSAPEMLTGYKETLRILSEVRHPGLETCLAFIEDGTYLGVVYPLPEGEWQSLASLLRAGPLPPERAVCIVHQLADAIRVLHSVQPPIIYGDLCPRKVMIGPQDQVLLIELEYAFRERRDLLENVGYAAPEQYGSVSPPDPEVDVYGLGAILYHCLTGLCPADAPYCIQPLRTVDPTADVRLARLVSRCTRIKKETRCSLRQLLHSLEQLSGSRPCSTGTQPFS